MWHVNRRAYPWTYFTSNVLTGAITITLAYLAFHVVSGGRVAADFREQANSADYVGYVAIGAVAYAFAVRLLHYDHRRRHQYRARRPDESGTAQGIAGGELVPGGR